MTDADLGAALRRAGLTPRALAAAWGTSVVAHLGPAIRARQLPDTPATAALNVFVAGEAVAVATAERGLGRDALAAALDRGLVELEAGRVIARVAVVPVGASLACCTSLHWPDDSSYHLIGCLAPGRAARWLDVGTGCAFIPLARPERASAITATEIDPAALGHARLGVALSGVRHVETTAADLTAGTGDGYDLVTFNLPIPAEAGLTTEDDPRFRHCPRGAALLARFVDEVRARTTRDATIVFHAWLGADHADVIAALPGEVTIARYSPEPAAPFGVVRWRPGAAAARRATARVPTADTPHLTWGDLDGAAPA